LAWVFQPENVKPLSLNVSTLSARVELDDSPAIEPVPPLALKVTVKTSTAHWA
jgi:hypothetical protein